MSDRIDKIFDKLGSIDVTLAEQHVTLKEHIRRTEILENQIEPIKKHVNMVNGALKLIGLLGVVAAIIESIHLVIK